MTSTTDTADCAAVIKSFEKHLLSAPSEAAIIGTTIPKLAAIQSNALSSAAHIQSLTSPPIPSEVLSAFRIGAVSAEEPVVDIPGAVFALGDQALDIKNWQQWLKGCIPCDLRVEFRIELIGKLDDQLLKILEDMVDQYLKQMSFILNLLNATDVYADVCPLLFAMSDICIPDLQRILALLAAILYRINVRELTGLDLMKLLILPIFQPIFSGLVGILNQYKILITDPLNCVVSNLDFQVEKLKFGNQIDNRLVDDLISKGAALGIISGEAQKAESRENLKKAREPFRSMDAGITAMQNSAGSAVAHLSRLMKVGIFEIETLLSELKSELAAFLGINDKETVEFLLNQYQKLLIFRLISFIAALIKAFTSGFNCNFENPAKAEDTVSKFLEDFLGPDAPIIVRNDSVTGAIQLFINPDLKQPLKDFDTSSSISTGTNTTLPPAGLTSSTVTVAISEEVQNTFSAIIGQSNQPVMIRPKCLFDPGESNSNKLTEWIKQLDASGDLA